MEHTTQAAIFALFVIAGISFLAMNRSRKKRDRSFEPPKPPVRTEAEGLALLARWRKFLESLKG